MSADRSRPDTCLSDAEFEALARGELAPAALERLRAEVLHRLRESLFQAVLGVVQFGSD